MRSLLLLLLCSALIAVIAAADGPSIATDLADVSADSPHILRIWGSIGSGESGLPVAGGQDVDGDGFGDVAVGAMLADPAAGTDAGVVFLAFGDGSLGPSFDSSVSQADLLRIEGSGPFEMTGSELWIDDVTGDGRGDLLIARQNFRASSPDRPGAGALTILVGGPELRTFAATLATLDLASPPPSLSVFTVIGAAAVDRLGIWMRTGDVSGDGIADIVVAADQEDGGGDTDRGAVYVIRGGSHLATNATVDLQDFGATILAGDLMKITPPAGSNEYHMGATCQIADLDGNGRAEVLAAAALNRAGATFDADGAAANSAHATGGSSDGTLYIAWDDNFTGDPWTAGFSFDISASPGARTIIDGGAANRSFGEEILGGLDYDDDGDIDLFVGDIVGDWSGLGRTNAGSGHVFYDASGLKGLSFGMDALPVGVTTSLFLGGAAGDIAADTALQGDFDADGIADLAFSSPHAAPFGRTNAGTLHVFFGRIGGWPASIDLAPGALPDPSLVRIAEIYGANARSGSDQGDTLSYSAQAGDLDGDGFTDLITNEMAGNGIAAGSEDTGNLIVLSGALVSRIPVAPASSAPGRAVLVALLAGAAGWVLKKRVLKKRVLQTRRRLSA